MEAQARLRYHNGQNQGKEYWVLKKVEVCGCGQVLAVLSSRMSAGGCSLAGCRGNVPCLAITAILFMIQRLKKKIIYFLSSLSGRGFPFFFIPQVLRWQLGHRKPWKHQGYEGCVDIASAVGPNFTGQGVL
jgi:hypothetical protein